MTSSILFPIACAAFAVSSLYAVVCFYNTFFRGSKTASAAVDLLVCGSYLIIKFLLFVCSFLPEINLLLSLLILYLVTFRYHSRFQYKAIGILIMFLFGMGVEVVSIYGYTIFSGAATEDVLVEQTAFLLINTVSILILLVIVKVYQIISGNREEGAGLGLKFCFRIMAVPAITVIIIYLVNHNIASVRDGHAFMVVTLLLLLINIVLYYLYEELLKVSRSEADNRLLRTRMKYYMEQYAQIQRNLREVRTLRHDLKHQLLYIQSRLKSRSEEDISQLELEISQLIGKTDINTIAAYTNHAFLDVMLNYKIKMAAQHGIEIEVISDIDANTIFSESAGSGQDVESGRNAVPELTNVDECVISNENAIHVILCNLLDNAIESFQAKESSQKKIIVKIHGEGHNLYVKISNPYSHVLRFQGKALMTSKKDKSMHGIGLKSVERLVNEQKGYMRLNWDDHIFMVELVLFHAIKEGRKAVTADDDSAGIGSPH